MSAPLVLLDANVLVPQRLSSLILTLATRGLFQPRWSDEILDETERTLVNKIGLERHRAIRHLDAMRKAFPRASVIGFESVPGDPRCDSKDQHVYAAAQFGSADLLVTFNLGDFRAEANQSGDVPTKHPDEFLLSLWSEHQEAVESSIEHEARRMLRPPADVRDVLSGIASSTPLTANTLHNHWGERPTERLAYELAGPDQSSYAEVLTETDFGKPEGAFYAWWAALSRRHEDPGAKELLYALTISPEAFGDFTWVDKKISGYSLASKVYFAVDAPEDVAYMRFVPEAAAVSRTIAPMSITQAVFVTLVHTASMQWAVWWLGDRMTSVRDIRRQLKTPRDAGQP